MLQWEAHKMRVKCICVLPLVTSTAGQVYLASGSSDGTIKIWTFNVSVLSILLFFICGSPGRMLRQSIEPPVIGPILHNKKI